MHTKKDRLQPYSIRYLQVKTTLKYNVILGIYLSKTTFAMLQYNISQPHIHMGIRGGKFSYLPNFDHSDTPKSKELTCEKENPKGKSRKKGTPSSKFMPI